MRLADPEEAVQEDVRLRLFARGGVPGRAPVPVHLQEAQLPKSGVRLDGHQAQRRVRLMPHTHASQESKEAENFSQ